MSQPPSYVLSRWVFLRLLGVVYLIAFVSLAVQITGLVGEHGILPAAPFLEQVRATYGRAAYRFFPTLCWFGAGDTALRLLSWGGAALAVLLIAGVAPVPVLVLLWAFYLSLSVVGQTFLSFQWDALLLETGLVAILYAPAQVWPSLRREPRPPAAMRWLLWWLLFRLMFLSGITKLASGDPTWRDLTALDYHFETQPLPPWTAWYAHHLPVWMHAGMTLVMFVSELAVPWLIFAPPRRQRLRVAAGGLLMLAQLAIVATGNYGFFNALAIVLCVPLVDDDIWRRFLPLRLTAEEAELRAKRVASGALVPVVVVVSTLAFVHEITATLPRAPGSARAAGLGEPVLRAFAPLRSINGYGLFRVMTTERPEIVIEGSRDRVQWSEYRFRWKPGDVSRRPRFVAPYHPRLDWQMWFAALNPPGSQAWLVSLVHRLLEGSSPVLSLLEGNPFPAAPPRYVRLAYYQYHFSTADVRSRTGAWWEREFKGYLTPALSLRTDQVRFRQIQVAAGTLGLTVRPLGVQEAQDFDQAFTAMTQERPDALFVIADPLVTGNRRRIVEFAAQHRLPAMYEFRVYADDGGLMAYGPSQSDMLRRGAAYVGKILKGAKPADLPVEQPTKFELVINMKTAKALGLTIPPSVLLRADEIIE